MMEQLYVYRREDNDDLVYVGFRTMMGQDAAGYITLASGVQAKRCLHLENHEKRKTVRPVNATPPPAISDSLGFPDHCLEKFEKHRVEQGCTDISFVRDPNVPEFIQVRGDSRGALEHYAKKRGLVNRTGSLGGGVRLSQDDLDRAAELVSRPLKEAV